MKRDSRYFILVILATILIPITFFIQVAYSDGPSAAAGSGQGDIIVNQESIKQGVRVVPAANLDVPVVEIATPNQKGVSYNSFDRFLLGANRFVVLLRNFHTVHHRFCKFLPMVVA